MNAAQKYLLENRIADLVINRNEFPENTVDNAKKWIYLSDIMTKFISEQMSNVRLYTLKRMK